MLLAVSSFAVPTLAITCLENVGVFVSWKGLISCGRRLNSGCRLFFSSLIVVLVWPGIVYNGCASIDGSVFDECCQ